MRHVPRTYFLHNMFDSQIDYVVQYWSNKYCLIVKKSDTYKLKIIHNTQVVSDDLIS